METVGESRRLTLEITPSTYHGDVHSSIAPTLFYGLKRGDEDILDVFDISEPNRYIPENSRTESGWTAEDFALSSSYEDGQLAIAQVKSCNQENGDDKAIQQIVCQLYSLKNFYPESYERLTGSYIIRVDEEPSEVRKLEDEVLEDLDKYGSSELDVSVSEVYTSPRDFEDLWDNWNE